MPTFEPGDVVKVPFPYTDTRTTARRPALVVAATGPAENPALLLWALMITSAENRGWPGDVPIDDLVGSGLPAPSVVRCAKIATLDAARARTPRAPSARNLRRGARAPRGPAASARMKTTRHLKEQVLRKRPGHRRWPQEGLRPERLARIDEGHAMKLHYYPETDSLYIGLEAGSGVETREVAEGVVADIDATGTVVGLDIDGPSRRSALHVPLRLEA